MIVVTIVRADGNAETYDVQSTDMRLVIQAFTADKLFRGDDLDVTLSVAS